MKSKLNKICQFLEQGLVEREIPVRLALLAALSGEHLLLLGPPGTAKSELARKLHRVFNQAPYFERLLTKFSVPEELFGPLSIKALEQDRYQRLTTNYLPEASIAFIDEVFKANSAILNALLTLLNEREFDNGSERLKTPLICVLAASNELPEDDSLQALYDRFLLRYQVDPVKAENFDALLDLSDSSTFKLTEVDCLSLDELDTLQQQAESIVLPEQTRALIKNLRDYLTAQEIYVSDRRWRKLIKLLKIAASTNGQTEITVYDCALLVHSLWMEPQQKTDLIDWLARYLQLDFTETLQRLEKLLTTWEHKSEADANRSVHQTNDRGEKLFVTSQGETTTLHEKVSLAERDNEVLYLAPPDQKDRTNSGHGYTLQELEKQFFDDKFKQTHINGKWVDVQNYVNNTQNRLVEKIHYQPLTEPWYFSVAYVAAANQDVQYLMDEIQANCLHYSQIKESLVSSVDDHLWLTGSFVEQSVSNIQYLLQELAKYHQRLQQVKSVIENLPIEEQKQFVVS